MPICCWRPGKYHNETCVERWSANKNPANIVHLNLYTHELIISSIKKSIASIFCDKLPLFQLNWGRSSVCCELFIVEGRANPVIWFLISYWKLVACRSANRKRQLANLGSMKPTPKIALIWGGEFLKGKPKFLLVGCWWLGVWLKFLLWSSKSSNHLEAYGCRFGVSVP